MQDKTVSSYYGPTKTLDELPEKFRSLFSSYPYFNIIQSEVLDNVMNSNKSVVIAAPTGSGKTAILELAIVKLLIDNENSGFTNDFKMVYVCPVKALCSERFNDWNPRFSKLGVSCIEVTGDGGDYFDLQGYNLIITTPEKWDSLTRKWRDNAGLVQLVKLFMIDEVHLLSDPKRGPVLEAIVCRMKTVSKSLNIEGVRFFAISATIYNVEDLAIWLGTKDSPAHCYKFGNEVRPVHLEKIVKGYHHQTSEKHSSFFFDIQLSYKLKPLILEHSKGKPTLVFCSTRKSVMMTSKVLSEQLTFHFSDMQVQNLKKGASQIVDGKLKELVMTGVGFHHAGVITEDRHVIQNLFVAGHLPILVATSTLAMGVNLPAHLVIVKSTQQFIAGKTEEYPESAILQMIGRAGRPQFDTTATAIIMTQEEKVAKYERLLESKEVLESSLHLHLPEHLNSEIVLHTITNIGIAMEWIRCTYLYVRALKNPRHYGFDPKGDSSKVEKSLETICEKEINGLKKAGLIELKDGIDISPTSNGKLMSHFYLSFETFKIFLEIKGTEDIPEILKAIAEAHEFSEMQLRVNERKTLNELNRNKNRSTIRFPLKGKVNTRALKINCLIQAFLGCLPIQDPGLSQEAYRIVGIAERLAKCLAEYLSKKPFYQCMLSTLLLAKSLHAKLWEDSPYVCRQLERIGSTLCSILTSCGKTSFDAVENSNPRDLERILNRAPPFGNVLQDAVSHLPKYNLKVEKHENRISIAVSLRNAEVLQEKNTVGDRHSAALIVGDSNNNLLYYSKLSDLLLCQKDFQIFVSQKDSPQKIIVDLISETWVGFDLKEEIEITPREEEPEKIPAQRKRKSVSQITKTPKKKKGLEILEDYSYKPKEKENFGTEETAIELQSEIKNQQKSHPVKILFKPCFDVDIEIPEEVLQRQEINNPQEEVKAAASSPKSFQDIFCAPSFDKNTSFLNVNTRTDNNLKPVNMIDRKLTCGDFPLWCSVKQNRNLMQFEESLNLTAKIEKSKSEDQSKSLKEFNEPINLTPKIEPPKLVNTPKTPSNVSLQNIYERLKHTPRSANLSSSRISLSDSGYFSSPRNF